MDGRGIFVLICFYNFISFYFPRHHNVPVRKNIICVSSAASLSDSQCTSSSSLDDARKWYYILLLAQLCDDILYYNTGKKPIYKNFKNNPVFWVDPHFSKVISFAKRFFFPVMAKIIWKNEVIIRVFFFNLQNIFNAVAIRKVQIFGFKLHDDNNKSWNIC